MPRPADAPAGAPGGAHLRRSPREPLRSLIARALTVWRRSVQARVAVSVLLLSAIVIGIVGWVLLRQITGGLVDNRVRISVAEARSETSVATERLRQAGTGDYDPNTQLRQLIDSLVERGKVRGFGVVVVGPVAGGAPEQGSGIGTRTSNDVRPSSVPDDLRRSIDADPGSAWTFTRIVDDAGRTTPGVVVGDQIVLPADGGSYDLFLLFPMSEEQDTLALLRSSMITAAVLLLLLVAGLSWLVARQVVTPIRLAREVAERIAAGRLEERVTVTGQDDIARLGVSFNQMADELQRQITQLEELSRFQQQFVSDVSHELRTPLTTVRMASDVLHDERARFDPVTARSAELLQTELDRFESLLADLLEVSRFDAGAAVLELDKVDLAAVAHRVVEATRPLAEQHGVVVAVRPDPGTDCVAEADVRRVERIVRNLLTNAIDHTRDSEIEVRLGADADTAALSVRDQGVGLRPGDSERVFDRFWRGDPARARTTGGTGLGLAISREDARLHGGDLRAWGRPDEGALFLLTLPRRAGESATSSPLPLAPAVSGRDSLARAARAARVPAAVAHSVPPPTAAVDDSKPLEVRR